MKNSILLAFLIFSLGFQSACNKKDDDAPNIEIDLFPSFNNERSVTVQGYSGDLMEPHISKDGQILLFNNFNSRILPPEETNETNLHYATRIDDITFEYMGEVIGANIDTNSNENELEGVPSLDINNKLYFIYTGDYFDSTSPNYLKSIFYGDFLNGGLTNIQSVPNLKIGRLSSENQLLGELNFDAEIQYNGDELYFVEGIFSGNPTPDQANIGIATKVNGIFVSNIEFSNLLLSVNSDALEYSPSISSNNLELYFTRASSSLLTTLDFGIYVATRKTESESWGNVRRIDAISGQSTEAPSISSDGKLMYYHKKINGIFQIFMVERI